MPTIAKIKDDILSYPDQEGLNKVLKNGTNKEIIDEIIKNIGGGDIGGENVFLFDKMYGECDPETQEKGYKTMINLLENLSLNKADLLGEITFLKSYIEKLDPIKHKNGIVHLLDSKLEEILELMQQTLGIDKIETFLNLSEEIITNPKSETEVIDNFLSFLGEIETSLGKDIK